MNLDMGESDMANHNHSMRPEQSNSTTGSRAHLELQIVPKQSLICLLLSIAVAGHFIALEAPGGVWVRNLSGQKTHHAWHMLAVGFCVLWKCSRMCSKSLSDQRSVVGAWPDHKVMMV